MKTILVSCMSIAAFACSCGNSNQAQSSGQTPADTTETTAAISIDGRWNIDNVVVNDSLSVRPSEETPEKASLITFDGGNYSITTNCNSIQGSYTLNGDSIALNPGLCTEMACDNMSIEDMIKQVLPEISTVDLVNDSTLRLNSPASAYIVLSRQK